MKKILQLNLFIAANIDAVFELEIKNESQNREDVEVQLQPQPAITAIDTVENVTHHQSDNLSLLAEEAEKISQGENFFRNCRPLQK